MPVPRSSVTGRTTRVTPTCLKSWNRKTFTWIAASPGALAEDGAKFLSKVAAQCSNKPFVKLGMGQSAPQGLLNLDLYFQNTPTQSLIGRIGRIILRSQDRD